MAEQTNVTQESNAARVGMNMDLSVDQIPKGVLTYSLNGAVENFDANGVSYQNEPGNVLCLNFPEGFKLIGKHFINEQNKHIFFLVNPTTDESEIGYMDNNDCLYHKYINSDCLNFSLDHPIQKSVHKTSNCTTEVYWTDAFNPRRFLDLQNLPYKIKPGTDVCDNEFTTEIDCNKLNVQPNFAIPQLRVSDVISGGNLQAGTVQFAIQYSNALGDAYTSYYSVTNPTPIAKTDIISADFNYPVGKSVVLDISNIDITGYFKYFTLAVIKTVNAIASAEVVGTYFIDSATKTITYSGQNQTQIKLTMAEIFEKFPFYEIADDVTAVADTLVWKGLTSIDRINYQKIASKITLQWETWRIPSTEDYSDELLATNFRSQLRDEVYPYEIVFLLDNGKQTDGFHIPGRKITLLESMQPEVTPADPDYIGSGGNSKYWQTYNTATVTGTDAGYTTDPAYKGPYQYGEFAYWESQELYPCNAEVWGDLAGQPIRHHKFPDVLVSPIFETSDYTLGVTDPFLLEKRAIFPIGVKMSAAQVETLVLTSDLTPEQKASIIGFKIIRGDRSTNKSIVAKGILRNVGSYTREEQKFYFPNYPYNDLQEDPFLLEESNSYYQVCKTYEIVFTAAATYTVTDCETNQEKVLTVLEAQTITVCSTTEPVIVPPEAGTAEVIDSATYVITVYGKTFDTEYIDVLYTDVFGTLTVVHVAAGGFSHPKTKSVTINVFPDTVPVVTGGDTLDYTIVLTSAVDTQACYPERLEAFDEADSKYRHVFNSPETSFGQPFLGDVLKLESVVFGGGKAHFVQVKDNANYKLLTKEAQEKALLSAEQIADIGDFNPTAMFTAYQAYLQIYINGITRRNYGWSYNSIASYNYTALISNGQGIKQRKLDISQYLIPGVQSVGDDHNINNFNRESSVYLKTTDDTTPLPFPSYTPSLLVAGVPQVVDRSRYINSQQDCNNPGKEFDLDVVSYYASLKNNVVNQWGQIYSYETVDTGTQVLFSENKSNITVFGGDTFISAFSFKTKLPFFIDNTVKSPDDADIFYDEIGNVAYPEYWHSSRSILYDYTAQGVVMKNIISIKAHKFDCPNTTAEIVDTDSEVGNSDLTTKMYYDGKMYLFAYGIPTFYVETSVNVDLRQAFNNREGDFYPHVSTGIPDDWVQESWVPIAQDNTYFYNLTYSKQNKENSFSHLPPNWEEELCFTNFPFRAIYSEKQQSFSDNRINSWLIYRPIAFFDFPQNYGEFTAIDGIENRQVLARFSNKTLLYNVLYTNVTNVQGQVYLGQPLFSKETPPLDYADTDLGYAGSQHKFLLKIPQGQITVDAKRGQVFLIQGSQAKDITGHGSGMNRFFTDHLAFEILRYFPTVDIDNNFKGLGLHGVYDSKFERFIITKLDYIPLTSDVQYDGEFFVNVIYSQSEGDDLVIRKVVNLTDSEYFCNKSWSLSFNMNTMSWVSFHSYLPNWYIAENNFFYSGLNESCDLLAIAATIPDCSLEGTLISCTIAGEAILIEPTTTTTTSTTSTTSTSTSTTSTTTTLPPPDCDLEGTAEQV